MKKITSIILIFSIGIVSCISDKKETHQIESKKEDLEKEEIIPAEVKVSKTTTKNEILEKREQLKPDTIKTFIVDDYPISDQLFKGKYGVIKSGELNSHDKVWLQNKELNQTIVFELYTDYHRFVTYHFDNSIIPRDLIKRMELHIDKGELTSSEIKKKEFIGLMNKSTEIESKKFTTNRRISLGDDKEKIVKIYGNPDTRKIDEGFEILEWSFEGDEIYTEKFENSEKPIARNSFGHTITLYFKESKLISQILFNDIP